MVTYSELFAIGKSTMGLLFVKLLSYEHRVQKSYNMAHTTKDGRSDVGVQRIMRITKCTWHK
jgi:hypothetical protein